MYIYEYMYIYSDVMTTIQCTHHPHHHNGFVVTYWYSLHCCLHDVTICFVHVEHSVCHEPIFVLIN